MKKSLLITGGAGYIGSHIALAAITLGHHVIIVDTVAYPWYIKNILEPQRGVYIQGDYGNPSLLDALFIHHSIEAVIHCAAYISVTESFTYPLLYYENNATKMATLLQRMHLYQIKNIVFSSSCAVYGTPLYLPLDEEHPRTPQSPYGRSKLIGEMLLEDSDRAYGIQYVVLRYFNAMGASPLYALGERHEPETHVIPRALHAATTGLPFPLYGTQHSTPDGTCIRDYIHVNDLADAHLKSLEYLKTTNKSICLNLGTGTGFSVLEIITAVEQVTHKKIKLYQEQLRTGDVPTLIANSTTAQRVLGWTCKHSTLTQAIHDSYLFHYPKPTEASIATSLSP
jgi:UDP-glucose 4-epimerase